MVRCHFSRLLGEHKKRVADVARGTGLHRHTLERLYTEEAVRIDLATIDKLCEYFNCAVVDLLEYVPSARGKKK